MIRIWSLPRGKRKGELLIINVLIFLGIASADYSRDVAGQIKGWVAAPTGGPAVYLRPFLPVMAVGFAVGVAGILIHCKRTRRRRDRSYKGQLACILVSVLGLFLYFLLA